MNKFNKGKLIGVVATSLSAVSLMGVGFATWIIGTQNKVADNEIAIEADDVSYKSLKVGVEFTGKIRLAETGSANPDDVFNFKAEEGKEASFTVSAKFTFTLGKDFQAGDFNFTKVNLSIVPAAEAGEGFKDNTVANGNAKVTRTPTPENLTYFDCPESITINTKNELKFDTTPSGKYKETTCTEDITFAWGTMFGVDGPNKFYNTEYGKLTNSTDKDTFVENAYDELEAMHKTYSGANSKIKLKIELAQ